MIDGHVCSLKVYRRGLQAIPLSVDLWLHYLTFFKENSDTTDPETNERIRAWVYNSFFLPPNEFYDSYLIH